MNRHDSKNERRLNRRRQITGLALIALIGSSAVLAQDDTRGFIYGKVLATSGSTFEGRLRWGDEEAFWDDYFNAAKTERKFPEGMAARTRTKEKIKIFGITVGVRWNETTQSRMFKARFGDIRRIHVRRGDDAILEMKSGTEYRISGGSNDVGAKIRVWDAGVGEIDLDWKRLETIEFLPTPRDLAVEARRLYGTVKTSEGEFRGFVQWDQDECLTTDKLDGDTRDGDVSIEMGRIGSIERHSRSGARVTLQDGREFLLTGSNDVNSSNNGIFVNDVRYGRVLVPWDRFDRIEFSERRDSGPGYDDFTMTRPLRGVVRDDGGNVHRGRLVLDLDEAETWEILDGNWRDIEYSIPLGLVASIVPHARDSSRVVLRSGETLELEDTADVGDGNAGVLILHDDSSETYVEWDDVESIELTH